MKIEFKYIITDAGAVLFQEPITHLQIAHGTKELKRNIYSAGFCTLDFTQNPVPDVKCFGRSNSLKLNSIPDKDKIVIEMSFNPISPLKYHFVTVKEIYGI